MRVLHKPHADEAALGFAIARAMRPRGVDAAPLAGRPGIAAEVLRELRAEGQPTPADAAALAKLAGPTRGIQTAWLRAVPLAAVPVDDIDTVLADIAAMLIERPDSAVDPEVASELKSITAWLDRADVATDFAAQLASDARHEQLLADAYAKDRRTDFDNMPSRVAALRTSVAMVQLLSDELAEVAV
jgi:hypothetical protein